MTQQMSELKATSSGEIRARNALLGYWWYEKSEADKVIAERKEKYNELAKLHDKAIQACCDADKVIAHHKYKRCLAMAKWCETGISYWDDDEQEGGWEYKKLLHCIRWKKRWLELAEKFKEAK